MSGELIVAMVAATSAIVVAALSALAARRNARELELLRSALAQNDRKNALHEEENRESVHALDELVASVQHLKDELLMLRNATDQSLRAKTIRTLVNASHLRIRSAYEIGLPHLTEDEAKTGHDAKRASFAAETLVSQMASSNTIVVVTPAFQAQVDALRIELTSLQIALREARMKRVYGQIPFTDSRERADR